MNWNRISGPLLGAFLVSACSGGPGGSGSPEGVDAGGDVSDPGDAQEVGADTRADATSDAAVDVTPELDAETDATVDTSPDVTEDVERDVDDSIPAVTGLEASDGAFVDRVELTWDEVEGATAYTVYRAGFEIAEVTTNTYADTEAPYASVSYDSIDASEGTLHDRIDVQVAGAELSEIPEVPYTVAARVGLRLGPESVVDTGSRALGDLTCAWERATTADEEAFTALDGSTDLILSDSDDAAVGESRFYRCRLEVEGIELDVTEVAEGYRGGCEDGIVADPEFEQFVDCGGVCPIACSAPEVLTESLPDAFRAEDYASLIEWTAVPPVSSVEVSVPSWADFDMETGELTGTPFVTDLGTADVEITLINDVDEVTVTIPLTARNRRIEQLEAGGHACAIIEGGTLRCWGSNSYGQLGYGNTLTLGGVVPATEAGDIDFGEEVIDVAVGTYHTCALGRSGDVKCWGLAAMDVTDPADGTVVAAADLLGYNSTGRLGDEPDETPAELSPLPLSGAASEVIGGGVNMCARLISGDFECWGQIALGLDDSILRLSPVFTEEIVSVVPGLLGGLVVVDDTGEVTVVLNQGDGLEFEELPVPAEVVRVAPMKSISSFIAYGVTGDGDLLSLSFGGGGVPVETGGEGVRRVEVGGGFFCALTESDEVYCGGVNPTGGLGVASLIDADSVLLDLGGPVRDLTVGTSFACALLDDESVRCWGGGRRFTELLVQARVEETSLSDILPEEVRDDVDLSISWGVAAFENMYSSFPAALGTEFDDDALAGGSPYVVEAPPVFLSTPRTTALIAEGDPTFVYAPVVASADGDPIEVAVLETPESMVIDDTDGLTLSWSPTVADASEINRVVLEASDGVNTVTQSFTVVPVPRVTGIELVAGGNHACARVYDPTSGQVELICWGDNSTGQLGRGNTEPFGDDEPIQTTRELLISRLGDSETTIESNWIALTVLTEAGEEAGNVGELDLADPEDLLRQSNQIAAGSRHSCAVVQFGAAHAVRCWGDNFDGQLGSGLTGGGIARYNDNVGEELFDGALFPDRYDSATLGNQAVRGVLDVYEVFAGYENTCVIASAEGDPREDASLYCWGDNSWDQLATFSSFPLTFNVIAARMPYPSAAGPVVDVAIGDGFICAVTEIGDVYCSGVLLDEDGATIAVDFGLGLALGGSSPLDFDGADVDVDEITAGRSHLCARAGSDVYCLGFNGRGQLGLGDTASRTDSFELVPGVSAESIAAGRDHTCAVDSVGELRCWGENNPFAGTLPYPTSVGAVLGYGFSTGIIGDDELASSLGATTLPNAALQIVAGGEHSCVLDVQGDVVCWGSGYTGALGRGDVTPIGDNESLSTVSSVPFFGGTD